MRTAILSTVILVLGGVAAAQDLPVNEALEQAIVVEELQHDGPAALERYRAIATDDAVDDAVRRHAWLRIGKLARHRGDAALAAEALQHAAQGDDAVAAAARELAARPAQDPERLAKLRAGAEAAVDDLLHATRGFSGYADRVLWFGQVATPVVVARCEKTTEGRYRLTGLLWRLGDPAALAYLRRLLTSENVEQRRAAVSGFDCFGAYSDSRAIVSPEQLALLRMALADKAARVVARVLEHAAEVLSLDDILPLVRDARDPVRLAALGALAQWDQRHFAKAYSAKTRESSHRIAMALTRSVASTSPDEFRAAIAVLKDTAMFSPEGRALIVQCLPQLADKPGRPRIPRAAGEVMRVAKQEGVVGFAEALDRIGPAVPGRSQSWVGAVLAYYMDHGWGAGAIDTVLTAARLGYVEPHSWLQEHAKADQAVKIVKIVDSPAIRDVLRWLSERELPEACFEPLCKVDGQGLDVYQKLLYQAIGQTGHPTAADYLLEHLESKTTPASFAQNALAILGSRRNDEATRAALRRALLGDPVPSASTAMNLFGQLVRMGDLAVLDHLAAVRARVGSKGVYAWLPEFTTLCGGRALVQTSALAYWLASFHRDSDNAVRWWHRYEPAVAAKAWQRLLAPVDGGWSTDWECVSGMLPAVLETGDTTVFSALCRSFAERCRRGGWTHRTHESLRALGTLLSAAARRAWRDHPEVVAEIDQLLDAALASKTMTVCGIALTHTPAPIEGSRRTRVLELAADAVPGAASNALELLWDKSTLTLAELENVLTRGTPNALELALSRPDRLPDGAMDLVRPLLQHQDQGVRIAACRCLGSMLNLDSVSDLLEALHDGSSAVRSAATSALQAIRFYHDEKAHWDRVFAGKAGLTAASAAEALLEQAKPGGDREQRLLAIRSLGVLGEAETLPFLIAWTKDPDAEIASEARRAIGRISGR